MKTHNEYSLIVSDYWDNSCKLRMVVSDICTEAGKYKPVATYLFNNLKMMSHVLSGQKDSMHGTVYITHEQNWKAVYFTTQELSYVIRKMKILWFK